MTTSFQPRKPAGSPQGGQFDSKPHTTLPDPVPEGIFGPRGFVAECGAEDTLKPYIGESWQNSDSDFARFENVSSEDAGTLLNQLPQSVAEVRQNGAPMAGQLLVLAHKYGGRVGGYVVRPPRMDERVSIDSVTLPMDGDFDDSSSAFSAVRDRYDLDALDEPDAVSWDGHNVELWWD